MSTKSSEDGQEGRTLRRHRKRAGQIRQDRKAERQRYTVVETHHATVHVQKTVHSILNYKREFCWIFLFVFLSTLFNTAFHLPPTQIPMCRRML
jgi:hypothetical protein